VHFHGVLRWLIFQSDYANITNKILRYDRRKYRNESYRASRGRLHHGMMNIMSNIVDNSERDAKIAKYYSTGKTMQEVGDKFGLTRGRVAQILHSRDDVKVRPREYTTADRQFFLGVHLTDDTKRKLYKCAEQSRKSVSKYVSDLLDDMVNA
jgi:hypothetical protein